jgi:hypothetical protein
MTGRPIGSMPALAKLTAERVSAAPRALYRRR